MDEARRRQLELFRSWTPRERLRRGMELTRMVCLARDARLRRQHPEVTDEGLRWIRAREVLGLGGRGPLP